MVLKQKFFKRFALVLFFLFVVNSLANIFFWYQSVYWFDDFTHFLGGVTGGLFLLWFFYNKYLNFLKNKKVLSLVLLHSLVFILVALLWEVMEFSVQDVFDIGNALAERADSVRDLLFGLLGNSLSLFYYFTNIKKYNVVS